ncbi:MAG: tryptophan--tRNA ligase [Anaerolineales bacterium]|nr:tryptophan--tRNA ligase [Anaerolineales bacterium]
MTRKISLSGIKPTGTLHLGNYLGMIRPALELVKEYRAIYFIADAHALNQLRDAARLESLTYEIAAHLLALGLDPDEVVFFRQSDVPEIFELTVILAASTSKGLLNRAHAYKAAVDANLAAGRDMDAGVNAGLYTYPVLMAADILLYGSHVVPVGQDQRQHVEMAADIAQTFNHAYGEVLVVPEALIRPEVALVPGTDGRKMSKSYANVIPIFAPARQLRKQIMGILTDSRPPEQPKDPAACNLFALYQHFAAPDQAEAMRQRYLAGGFGYGEVKAELFEALEARFGAARERYENYMADRLFLEKTLLRGADRARAIGGPLLERVRAACGLRYYTARG